MENPDRNLALIASFNAGETVASLTRSYGLSRARVLHILLRAGITPDKSGQVYGVDAATIEATPMTLRLAYLHQRKNARARGIEWQLTLTQWLRIWEDSGHLEERGAQRGQYVMARKGDVGPYSVKNVVIKTSSDNHIEAHPSRTGPRNKFPGVWHQFPGRAKGWVAKHARTIIGYYPDEETAVAAKHGYLQMLEKKPKRG